MRATDNPPATIPAEILDTSARPDIVIVGDSEITLIELFHITHLTALKMQD